jgi:hypothetical protein
VQIAIYSFGLSIIINQMTYVKFALCICSLPNSIVVYGWMRHSSFGTRIDRHWFTGRIYAVFSFQNSKIVDFLLIQTFTGY